MTTTIVLHANAIEQLPQRTIAEVLEYVDSDQDASG